MRFSVITVALNPDIRLVRAVKSILSQKNVEVELILQISKDKNNIVEMLKDIHLYDEDHCVHIQIKEDKGIYDGMNRALSRATGDVITFLNSDDFFLHDNVLSCVEEIILSSKKNIVLTGVQFFQIDNINKLGRKFVPHKSFLNGFWHAPHPGFFIARSVLIEGKHSFDTSATIGSDVAFMSKIIFANANEVFASNIVTVAMSEGGVSNRGLMSIYTANREVFGLLRPNFGVWITSFFIFEKLTLKLLQVVTKYWRG